MLEFLKKEEKDNPLKQVSQKGYKTQIIYMCGSRWQAGCCSRQTMCPPAALLMDTLSLYVVYKLKG